MIRWYENRRRSRPPVWPALALLTTGAALLAVAPVALSMEAGAGEQEAEDEGAVAPPPPRQVRFQAPPSSETPRDGAGRLTLTLDGNRRWCTYPDDRVVKPPRNPLPRPGTRDTRRSNVFTFGYQFTIAAVRRGDPTRLHMLYESPVVRTASMRAAAKLGRGGKRAVVGPGVGGGGRGADAPRGLDSPGGLVPFWDPQYRCTTLDEMFEFDLAEGIYDVYAAFDVMNPRGDWAHRTVAFIEEVPVKAGRRTRLQGLLNLTGARQRDLELVRATLDEAGTGPGEPTVAP